MSVFLYFISFFFSFLFFDKNIVNREYNDYNISSDTLLFPKAKHREQSKLIYQLLSKYHYKKVDVDDSLSMIILKKYIESLDPNREYFYKSDIDYFNQYKMQMDDYIISGYLEPAYEIFTVYHQRVKDRISFVFTMLEDEPDFSAKEFLYFQNLKHNSILPFLLWDDILQHTLFKYHAMKRNESYECLPSKKYIQSNQKLIQKIHKHLDF